MRAKELTKTIKRTEDNVKFLLEDNDTPITGIKKVITYWTVGYATISIFLFFLNQWVMDYMLTNQIDMFSIPRILTLILYICLPIFYFIGTKKIEMTNRERDFLKNFSIFIIIFSLMRIVFPLSYYLDIVVLLQLYDSIPYDVIITIIALFSLNAYLKDSNIIICLVLNVLLVIALVWSYKVALSVVNPEDSFLSLKNILDEFRFNGGFIVFSFLPILISTYLRKDKFYE